MLFLVYLFPIETILFFSFGYQSHHNTCSYIHVSLWIFLAYKNVMFAALLLWTRLSAQSLQKCRDRLKIGDIFTHFKSSPYITFSIRSQNLRLRSLQKMIDLDICVQLSIEDLFSIDEAHIWSPFDQFYWMLFNLHPGLYINSTSPSNLSLSLSLCLCLLLFNFFF